LAIGVGMSVGVAVDAVLKEILMAFNEDEINDDQ
jgi:hypothetical protein